MLCNIVKTILEENITSSSIKEVNVYYSKMNNRKALSIEFDEDMDYTRFLTTAQYIISEDDISFQDSTLITIDLTEDVLNRILEYTKMVCINEFDNIRKI